ncbi:hypothetical protein MTO96_047154 [Rhipicephalus appendiculatus]
MTSSDDVVIGILSTCRRSPGGHHESHNATSLGARGGEEGSRAEGRPRITVAGSDSAENGSTAAATANSRKQQLFFGTRPFYWRRCAERARPFLARWFGLKPRGDDALPTVRRRSKRSQTSRLRVTVIDIPADQGFKDLVPCRRRSVNEVASPATTTYMDCSVYYEGPLLNGDSSLFDPKLEPYI